MNDVCNPTQVRACSARFAKCVAGRRKLNELNTMSVTDVRLLSRKVFFICANSALLLALVLLKFGVFGIFLARRVSVYTKPTMLRHMVAALIAKYMPVCGSGILCKETVVNSSRDCKGLMPRV